MALIDFDSKRFRIYPLIILIVTWSIVAINIATHTGWQGGFGQIIGIDFLTHYIGGQLYRFDIENLYNYEIQANLQQAMISPAPYEGVGPFISPPYVAFAFSFFTYIPYTYAYILWLALSLLFVFASVPVLMRLIVSTPTLIGLSNLKLLIILLSFFPLVNGWIVGQNHTLTLLLTSGIILAFLNKKPGFAGFLAGLLIYKPQFILGFLIVWIVWREYRSLLTFFIVCALWISITLFQNGIDPYFEYLSLRPILLNLPYMPGYPGYLQITTYGFLTTLLPDSFAPLLQNLMNFMIVIYGVGLAYIAFRTRNNSIKDKLPAVNLAVLFPLIATPYVLFHDLIILLPILILWAGYAKKRNYLYALLLFYFGGIILPVVGFYSQVAIMALIPIIVLLGQIRNIRVANNWSY